MRQLFYITAIFCLATIAYGTDYEREINPFDVWVEGTTLALPFSGGFNSPKPLLIDINNDNLTDLLVGDVSGRIAYYQNIGTASSPQWTETSHRLGGIDAGTWYTMADIDGDNDFDLFCDNRNSGVMYYDNITTTGPIQFTLIDSALGGFETGFNNTPAFVDLDNDNDLDFFFGALTGRLEFYRNDGDINNPLFVFVTDVYDSILAYPGGPVKAPQHGFSNIKFDDVDSDGDFDLFFGDIFNHSVYFFPNLGSASISDLTHLTDNYLPGNTLGFNHPTFADMDNDNDNDMVVGVANNAEIDNLRYYRNEGTAQAPSFVELTSNFIKMIDHIANSTPTLGDIDGDNDLDLLVGNISGQLTFYENQGTKLVPEFVWISDSYMGIDVGSNSTPYLVNIDNDSDLDLLIGNQTGKIQYWRNEGDFFNFSPVLVSDQLDGIKVDQIAIPVAADMNQDGLIDLVIGEWDFNGMANVLLYQNIGTEELPQFALKTKSLLPKISRDFTLPHVFDWDGDGKVDLLLSGKLSGTQIFLNNAVNGFYPDSLTLILQPDSLPGSDLGYQLAPCFGDIDYDGDMDFFLGEKSGGINFFRAIGSCCIGDRGNVNNDPLDEVDISDLTALVDYLFRLGEAPACLMEANFSGDADEHIDITDLVVMVAYIFRDSGVTYPCPPAE